MASGCMEHARVLGEGHLGLIMMVEAHVQVLGAGHTA